jgi:hypothetical protein
MLTCICTVAVFAIATTVASARQEKICLCHNGHTICIAAPAVPAHLRHGDTLGECPVSCDSSGDCGASQFCKRDSGVCGENAIGVCTNRPVSCPSTIAPVCGCDGTTYDNACLAAAAGATVSHNGACPVPGACGGDSGATCGESQFCKHEAGACDANAEGVCTSFPAACPTNVDPVCGCDGKTYSNACAADGAGVNVASAGACPEGVACGGAAGDTCAVGEFCKLESGACSADAEGVCTVIPGVCEPDVAPVCGCDGVTYSNECFAASAGASIAAAGACAQGAACVVGGGTCAAGEFCRPHVGDCAAAAAGNCTKIPEVCPPAISNIPVCACDGVTYANACKAFSTGVGIASVGECGADQQACGGAAGTCPTGEVCLRPLGECAADAEGICHPTPVACQGVINPVCGCDGVTYDNACVAAGAGATVDHEGECGEPEGCDGLTGVTCPEGQFCKHADGACEADVEGVCTEKPLTCEPVDNPVCACTEIGFPNACFANAVGFNIDHTGVCTP